MAQDATISIVNSSPTNRDQRLSTAFIGMESQLCDVQNMVRIVITLLEDKIGHDHSAVTGHKEKYWLASEDVNMMLFSAYHAQQLVNETVERWYAEVERSE